MAANRKTGTVTYLSNEKPYGFIRGADGGGDIFFHFSEIKANRSLVIGDSVEYVETQGNRGSKAADVTVVVVERKTGTINWYRDDMGYGFIDPDDGSEQIFVHRSDIKGGCGLTEGEKVEYAVKPRSDGKFKAVDVTGPGGADVRGGGGGGGDSPPSPDKQCFKCGQTGHKAKNCLNPGANVGGEGSDFGCFKCGDDSHHAKDCKLPINSQIGRVLNGGGS